jgi:hypothetical protein
VPPEYTRDRGKRTGYAGWSARWALKHALAHRCGEHFNIGKDIARLFLANQQVNGTSAGTNTAWEVRRLAVTATGSKGSRHPKQLNWCLLVLHYAFTYDLN